MKTQTVQIEVVMQVELPRETCIDELNLGLANARIMRKWEHIEGAKVSTWWIEKVQACNSTYITCHRCNKVQLVCRDAVILDDKPLCLICSAEFNHGQPPELAHMKEATPLP